MSDNTKTGKQANESGYEKYTEAPGMAKIIENHRPEINHLLQLDDSDKQRVEFRKLGFNPDEMMANYGDLVKEALDLRKRNETASKWVNTLSAASGTTTLAVFFKLDKRHFADKPLFKWIMTVCATITASATVNFFTTKLFTGKLREKGQNLSMEARDAFEREMAMAMESRDRQNAISVHTEQEIPKQSVYFTTNSKPAILPRDSYSEEAVKPKQEKTLAMA